MDIDPIADRFKHIVGHEPVLDQIAHGTYFGEAPRERRGGRARV